MTFRDSSAIESLRLEEVLNLLLAEYTALRAEIVVAVDRQYSIMNWGTTALAALLVAVVHSFEELSKQPLAAISLLAVATPCVAVGYVWAWSRMFVRINNLGSHLYTIEDKIEKLIGLSSLPLSIRTVVPMPISWEHSPIRFQGMNGVRLFRRIRKAVLLAYVTPVSVLTILALANFGTLPRDFLLRARWFCEAGLLVDIGVFWFVVMSKLFSSIINELVVNAGEPAPSLAKHQSAGA